MNNPTIHVAIADDHTVVRDSISKMIATFPGFKVTIEASNGKDLIQQLRRRTPFPEICVLDIQMPEMNGYEAMAYIKQKWPRLKVLALSMLDDEFAVIKMLKLGARGYIVKSSGLEELQKALNAIHERDYYSSELVASNFFHLLKGDKDETLHNITDREQQFLKYCPTEMTIKEIAQKMGVSTSTAQGYRNNLFDKLNLKTRQGLAIFAVKSGIVSFEDL